MKRSRMDGARSRSLFRNTANKTHKKNLPRSIMRGGIRL